VAESDLLNVRTASNCVAVAWHPLLQDAQYEGQSGVRGTGPEESISAKSSLLMVVRKSLERCRFDSHAAHSV
jgi:hypothetical protein